MLVSEKRLAANRANAQKSTGPRTPDGKSKSSQNALTHGLTAASGSHSIPLLPTESPDDYQSFLSSLHEEHRPQTPTQALLVERIAHLLWRLRRIPAAEAELFNRFNEQQKQATQTRNTKRQKEYASLHFRDRQAIPEPAPDPVEDHSPSKLLAHHFTSQDDKTNPFTRLHRYESSLERSLNRSLKELRQLQREQQEQQQNEPTETLSPESPDPESGPLHPAPDDLDRLGAVASTFPHPAERTHPAAVFDAGHPFGDHAPHTRPT